MPKRKRLQLGLKTLFVAFTLVGIGVVVIQWLQTDTIIYFEKSCTIRLPDGQRVTTNRWFNRGGYLGDLKWGFVLIDVKDEYHLCDPSDTTKITVLQCNGEEHPAVVVDSSIRGSGYRYEYWVRFIRGPNSRCRYWIRSGKRLEPSTN